MQAGRRAFLTGRAIPRPQRAAISDACLARQGIDCRTCGERCDSGAISFSLQLGGAALPRIDAEACSGCGDCVADCPGSAISLTPFIPQQGTRP